jgi:hypothetical protein
LGGLLLFLVLIAAPAMAGDQALAEALFMDGKRLLDEHKYKEACTKFEASQRQDPSPGTLLNLGRCNEAQGKTATAWARYTEAATLARNMSRPEQEAAARERIAALEPKLSKLSIEPPATAVDGLTVKRGDVTMGADSLGMAVPVDPGEYVIEASAPGYEPWKGSVKVNPDGASASIRIPDLKRLAGSAPSTGAAEPGATTGGAAEAETGTTAGGSNATLGWVVVGVGGAVLVTGAIFGLLAQQQATNAEDDPALCPDKRCSPAGREEIDGAETKALISTIGVGAGVVAIGVGVYLVASSSGSTTTGSSARRKSFSARLVPVIDPRSPGVALSGGF